MAVPKSEQAALTWINGKRFDADRVQAIVDVVEIDLGDLAKSPTQANLDQLAMQAQTAHDDIDGIRDDFAAGATDSGTVGDAEVLTYSGVNDLKNAMGALVAYTGDPNPANLAHFSSQWHTARAEWNDGIRAIWRIAHRKRPPTI